MSTRPHPAVAERLRDLARGIGRLSPDWGNPERYFERRDELERAARQLAREVNG